MHKISKLSLAVAVGLAINSSPAFAAEEKAKDNRIIITGSHIKRLEQEPSSPLVILSSDDIKQSGVATLSELLQTTVYSNGSSLNNQQTGGFTPGAANYNLRGLRTDRTLVLIDGKRLPSYPFGQNGNIAFVDLNSIPLAEVESVEILKDGASAVYGSDAIAGVVNIITKQEFDGSEISAKTTHSDSGYSANTISYLGGFSTEKQELMVIAEYQDFGSLLGKDNDFSSRLSTDEASVFASPGTYITFDDTVGLIATPAAGCQLTASANNVSQSELASWSLDGIPGEYCINDWASDRQLLPENKRALLSLKWNMYLGESTVYAGVSANQTKTESDVPFGEISSIFYSPEDSPFNPIGEELFLVRGFSEIGLQTIDTTANNYRLLVGMNGLLGEYDYDVSFNHGETEVKEVYKDGWMTYDSMFSLFDAIDNDEINPFAPLTQSQIDTYTSAFNHTGRSYQSAVSFSLSGELAEWDAGSVYFASGVELRKEYIQDTSDESILSNNVVGLGNSSAEGDRDISSIFGEFILPASDKLELNLAVRYDDYSDFGSSVNPKASLKYVASDDVLIRASWGTGFRAPNLFELHSGEVVGQVGQIPVVSSGNLELDAESSESFNFGIVKEFGDDHMFSIDAWQINVEDMITNLGVAAIVNSLDENGNGLYEDYVIYNGDGSFSHIFDPFLNIDKQSAKGIDFDSKWRLTNNIDWKLSFTHLVELEQENADSIATTNSAGEYLFPKNRINSSLSLKNGDFRHSLLAYHTGEHGEGVDKVDSYTKFDYQLQYSLADHNFTFMIANLADEDIPTDGALSWPYYEQRLYSPLGRTYSLQWKYLF